MDYIGRYLLQYVQRKDKDKAQKSSHQIYEQKERELKFEEDRKSVEKNKLLEEQNAIEAKLPAFIESLISCNPEVITHSLTVTHSLTCSLTHSLGNSQ